MKSLMILVGILLLPMVNALEITEVMANPEGNDDSREWIEIYSEEEIEVEPLRMRESDKNHLIVPIDYEKFIGYAIVADNVDKFLEDYPDYEGFLFDSSFSLSNSGELIEITYDDEVIVSIEYSEVEEGLSWCNGACEPSPGYAHVEQEESDYEDESGQFQCSPKMVTKVVEKEIPVEVEKIVTKEIEKKDLLIYSDVKEAIFLNENVTSEIFIVNQFDKPLNITIQSYLHLGSELKSESYLDGVWMGGWSGNKQTINLNPESMETISLVNRATESGNFNLRIKIETSEEERKLDHDISILEPMKELPEYEPKKEKKESGSIIKIIKKLFNV